MPVDRWPDLVGEFGDPAPPSDLREQVERRVVRLQAEAGGATWWSPRWSSVARWVAAGIGMVLVIAALAIAAHSRREAPASGQQGQVQASVVLVGQQGRYGGGSVVGWYTKEQGRVTCGAHPAVTGSVGNNGIRPSDVCRALAYYPAHSTESRCNYASVKGPVVPHRVLITGTINGQAVHLNMGMRCNPSAKLAQTTGLIWATVFGYPNAVKATLSESIFARLTRIAKRQAQALEDPNVHSAEVVLTTRRRMNTSLGLRRPNIGTSRRRRCSSSNCSARSNARNAPHPPAASIPTGTAAQDVLAFGSLAQSDFGLTSHPLPCSGWDRSCASRGSQRPLRHIVRPARRSPRRAAWPAALTAVFGVTRHPAPRGIRSAAFPGVATRRQSRSATARR